VRPRSRSTAALVGAALAAAACGVDGPNARGSPDTRIAFSRGFATWVVAPDGGRLTKLSAPYRRTRRAGYLPRWSPDGTRIAFSGYLERDARSGGARYHVHVMNADGSGVRNLTRSYFRETGNFDWAPDGERLVVDVWNERTDRHRLHVIRTDAGPPRLLTGGDDYGARWSPDGSTIAFNRFRRGGSTDLYAIGADGTGLRRLARRANAPAWSPDGATIAYFSGFRPATIYLVDAGSGAITRLATQPGEMGELTWSPDGAAIAYQAYRPRRGWDIYVVEIDGALRKRLTHDRGDEVSPTWSPDGAQLAFEASTVAGNVDNTGTYDVYVIDADGTDRRRVTRCRCTGGGGLSWQPRPR
jgi:Tol biopolymer transport system component